MIDAAELRQIIRDELSQSNPTIQTARSIEAPLTGPQLCEFLNITEPTLIRWRKKGKIPFLQLGGSIRYDKEAVLTSLIANTKGGKKYV